MWLKALSGKLKKDTIRKLLESRHHMMTKEDQELADSVLVVSLDANVEIVEELRGDESMNETLMEIMEPTIKQREDATRKEAIQGAVILLRDVGQKDDAIKIAIMRQYNLTEDAAKEYLKK